MKQNARIDEDRRLRIEKYELATGRRYVARRLAEQDLLDAKEERRMVEVKDIWNTKLGIGSWSLDVSESEQDDEVSEEKAMEEHEENMSKIRAEMVFRDEAIFPCLICGEAI